MLTRFVDSRVLLLAALLLLGVPAAVWRLVPAQAAGKAAQSAPCAIAGNYQIGQSPGVTVPPMPGSSAQGEQTILPVYPITALRGTLTITTYSGCGTPTAGTFTVRRLIVPVPRVQPQQGTSQQTIVGPCLGCVPVAGVNSATGTFAQDAEHPGDPRYVSVSGTVITARPGPEMGVPCTTHGCPPPPTITSTVAFTDVTGYLQVARTGLPGAATLSFLPPPDVSSMIAPAALTLVGARGHDGVQPQGQGAQR